MERIFHFANLAIRVKPEAIDLIDEYYEVLTGSSEPPSSHRDFLMKVVNKSIENFKKRPSKKEDLEKIAELQEEIIRLTKETQETTSEHLRLKNKLESDYQEELKEEKEKFEKTNKSLTAKNKELTLEVEGLINNKFELQDNQVIITLPKLHWQLIKKYLKSEKVIKLFAKENKNGEFNTVLDLIDNEDNNKNIETLLLNCFILAVYGKRLVIPKELKKSVIDSAIKKIVEENKKKQ